MCGGHLVFDGCDGAPLAPVPAGGHVGHLRDHCRLSEPAVRGGPALTQVQAELGGAELLHCGHREDGRRKRVVSGWQQNNTELTSDRQGSTDLTGRLRLSQLTGFQVILRGCLLNSGRCQSIHGTQL